MAEPITVDDGNFKSEVLDAEVPVLVDFWASWCGPCRMIAPIVEQIAAENEGRLKVAKLDVDANQTTSHQFGVMSIPTLIIFKGGKPMDRLVGYMPKDQLQKAVEKYLG